MVAKFRNVEHERTNSIENTQVDSNDVTSKVHGG